MTLQAWYKPVFGEFLPFLLCRSAQALSGWMGTVAVQVFSGLQVKVRALAGRLKDILRLVLLECEPPPQSEVLITLEQVFIKDHQRQAGCHVPFFTEE